MTALLALARVGGATANDDLFRALEKFPLTSLSDRLKIQKLRVIEVAVSRSGKPSAALAQRMIADVDRVFPASSFELNTEMSQILAAFDATSAVSKTMRLARESQDYRENFAYRYNIRSVTAGWTPELRRDYFQWFNLDHSRGPFSPEYRDWFNRVNQQPRLAGNDAPRNLVRTAALATLTEAEKADEPLAAILAAFRPPAAGGRGGGAAGGAPANPFGAPGGGARGQ